MNRGYLAYFTAIAIALSLPSSIKAQSKTDGSLGNIRERLSSEWSNAVLTRSLESTTQINAIKFSPNGQLLASVGASQVSIWNLERGGIQRVLPGHYASDVALEIAPTAIAFSPDSRFVATASWSQGLLSPDQAIKVQDIATGEVILDLAEADGCRQIMFDVGGEIIYSACGLGVSAWSFPDGEKLFSFDTAYPVEAIALSPDGMVMATVYSNVSEEKQEQDHQIQLWQLNASKPQLINTLNGHANDIAQLEFTSNGKRLVSSSYDGKINVWNWRQGTIDPKTNNLHSDDGVFSLSANSQLIAGNFHSSTMTSLVSGLPLRNTLKLKDQSVAKIMAFSPRNQLFAQVKNNIDSNSVINLWSLDSFPSAKQPNIRANYQAIPITKYWINQEQQSVAPQGELQGNKPTSIGQDPQAIALSALGLTETLESQQEQVEVNSSNPNLATVSITQTNLADDSIAGIRYLIEFAPYGAENAQKWQIVWAGEQFRCQSGRGHQDWGIDLCH